MNRWLLLCLWWPLLAGAQSPVVLHGTPAWTQPVDIARQVQQFTDLSGLPLPFETIRRQPFRPFIPQQMDELRPSSVTEIVTWLTFRVQNTHAAQPADVLFQVGRQGQIDLLSATGHLLQRTGTYFLPYNVQDWQPLRLHIIPGQTSTFFVKITNRVRIIEPIIASLHTPASLRGWFATNSYHVRWLFLGLSIIAGGLFIMSIFALAQYYFNREYVYLYYALFCLFSFCLVILNMNFRFGLGLPVAMRSTNQYLTFIIAFFYILFIENLARLSVSSPKLWRILQGFLILFVFQECVIIYEYRYGLLFRQNWLYLRQEVSFVLAGVLVFIVLLRSPSPYRNYLLAGIGALWFISYFQMFIDFRLAGGNPSLSVFVNYVPFFFALGALIENFFFLLALAYRNKLTELEKIRIQNQYTRQLQEELLIRSIQIESKNKLLESQRRKQLENEFDQRLADSEMSALRAQMNPHFIFNCLNSIKLYTLQNDTDKASDYLTKFARLIRLVLENSRADRVTLEHELNALQLYIDLEAMRFKQKVQIAISVAADIDRQFVQIPPLLLQPYVENAIWHGLMHKPEGGTVSISVTQPSDGRLRVEITDNGIGRARASELKSKSAGHSKSFGMQVTADRIRMINQLYHAQTEAAIYDLAAPNGEATGTKVVLEIPV